MCQPHLYEQTAHLLSIAHLLVFLLALVGLRKHVLLLTAALDLVSDELLVLLQTALDMQLEAHDIIKHAFDFGVEFFAQRIRTELELFVSTSTVLALPVRNEEWNGMESEGMLRC